MGSLPPIASWAAALAGRTISQRSREEMMKACSAIILAIMMASASFATEPIRAR